MKRRRAEAAKKIQRFYRTKLAQEKYKLLLEKQRKIGNRILIKKSIIFLVPFKTYRGIEKPQNLQDYYLMVYAIPPRKELSFNLSNVTHKIQFEYKMNYAHLVPSDSSTGRNIKQERAFILRADNYQKLITCIDQIIPRFHIEDHVLSLRNLEVSNSKLDEIKKDEKVTKNDADTEKKSEKLMEEKNENKERFVPTFKVRNLSKNIEKIVRIQKMVRAKLIREKMNLHRLLQFKTIYQKAIKTGEVLLMIRILEAIKTKDLFLHAIDLSREIKFQKILFPRSILDFYSSDFSKLIEKVVLFSFFCFNQLG
jgi:hypothetical protein